MQTPSPSPRALRQPSKSLLGLCTLGILGAASAALWFTGCGADETPEQAAAETFETLLVRERVAHWFSKDKLEKAREVIAPLVASKDADPSDLIRAAAVEFGLSERDRANGFLDRAEQANPNDPALHFLRGQMARELGEYDEALLHLRKALEFAPDDLPTAYVLAQILSDLDQFEEAEALFRAIVETGIENGGSWYVSALYRLERLLTLDGRGEEAKPFSERREELNKAGLTAVDAGASRVGTFGRIAPPEPQGEILTKPIVGLFYEPVDLGLPSFIGATGLLATDLDGDGRSGLLGWGPQGIVSAIPGVDGWEEFPVSKLVPEHVLAFDLDNEPDAALEILAVVGDQLHFFRLNDDFQWAPIDVQTPELPGKPSDLEFVDFDHEGDIDLLLTGDFGARLWRNDGAWVVASELKGSYVDVTKEAGLPTDRSFAWCAVEDFDGDDDVDLLMGGAQGHYLADSLRGGRFADLSARVGSGLSFPKAPMVADISGDGRPDIVGAGQWFKQQKDHTFGPSTKVAGVELGALWADLDQDGTLDVLVKNGDKASVLLAVGTQMQVQGELHCSPPGPGPVCALDGNVDGLIDLCQITEKGVELLQANGKRGGTMRVIVRGNKSNKRGVGSVVEVRVGTLYRRIYYRGETLLVGVGEAQEVQVVRITYPNGAVLTRVDVALDSGELIDDPSAAMGEFEEPASLIGSCPFLYTWNGEHYEFITDVLGITPLGLPMAPGMLVPPDHDEFVLVTGEQLKEQGGLYKVQFTEELREVTYLDRARLDVVDHPIGTEVFPNELFKFPPFPEEHLHSVKDPSALVKATGSDGQDWTASLAQVDADHAIPFTKHLTQYQGLAHPWFLELEFDPERIASAQQLRLVMTGWFFWSDASANMAAARTPGVDFIPPMILVPDGKGGWRETGPPIGFPAGKTKTMIVDLAGLGLEKEPRIRVMCSLQLFWDRIVLATDGDDAPRVITSLEPKTAMLSRRGFSAPLQTGNPGSPERFDWDILAQHPRWNPHPGNYTKLGECVPLLHAVDDQYVIMGTGEALEVHFDASQVPPLPAGYRRDYLLYLDGWAKDRDHNTLEALEVEPLPFHGMSGYPYGPDESFPTDEAHQTWRAEWNTRPAQAWLERLANE